MTLFCDASVAVVHAGDEALRPDDGMLGRRCNNAFVIALQLQPGLIIACTIPRTIERTRCARLRLQVGREWQDSGYIDDARLAPLPEDGSAPAGDGGATLYRCRKCRRLVATSRNAIEEADWGGTVAGCASFADRHSVKGHTIDNRASQCCSL